MTAQLKSRGPAPVHLWNPPFCGDIDMLIARDGTWYHEGKPIRRPAMVTLFANILMLGEDGRYYLVTPVEKVRIKVEDCPFVALQMEVIDSGGEQRLEFTTNTGEEVVADADHPIRVDENPETGEPHPTIHIRSGLQALINRPLFYRLAALAEEQPSNRGPVLGVCSAGQFFELGRR